MCTVVAVSVAVTMGTSSKGHAVELGSTATARSPDAAYIGFITLVRTEAGNAVGDCSSVLEKSREITAAGNQVHLLLAA
ncbi:hypothetical protein [Streptomyces lydicus]|uniref:hypothetical protein n=1 Tax=Streptomyces lydicus TaxID=47763 RepID=UPI0037A17B59